MTPPPDAPHLLDLYSGAGGAAVGYHRAGFRVTGVDVRPMPRYPYDHHHADALNFLEPYVDGTRVLSFPFQAVHASPPCQGHSRTARFGNYVWPELIEPTRSRLDALGVPYVIENVRGAPLIHDPGGHSCGRTSRWVTELCGCMFPGQMFTYRPRRFETNFYVVPPSHQEHVARNAPLGRRPAPGEFMHVVGNPTGAEESRRAMGISWMQRRELCEAIPPPFTEYIGRFLMDAVTGVAF